MTNILNRGLGESDSTAELGTPANPLHKILTIPNAITSLRLIFTVCFLFMYPHDDFHLVGIVLFIIAACTDWLDGKLARSLHQVSWFGKRFDPIMDRVLIFSGVIALAITYRLPVWACIYLAIRDLYLLVGGFITMRMRGRIPDVCYIGKACTFILMAGFSILLLDLFIVPGIGVIDSSWLPGFGSTSVSFGIWLVYIGCVLSLIAAVIYTVRGAVILRSSANDFLS